MSFDEGDVVLIKRFSNNKIYYEEIVKKPVTAKEALSTHTILEKIKKKYNGQAEWSTIVEYDFWGNPNKTPVIKIDKFLIKPEPIQLSILFPGI